MFVFPEACVPSDCSRSSVSGVNAQVPGPLCRGWSGSAFADAALGMLLVESSVGSYKAAAVRMSAKHVDCDHMCERGGSTNMCDILDFHD